MSRTKSTADSADTLIIEVAGTGVKAFLREFVLAVCFFDDLLVP